MTVDQKEKAQEHHSDDQRSSPTLSARQARQGRIVLNSRTKQGIFLAAFILIGVFALLALIGALF